MLRLWVLHHRQETPTIPATLTAAALNSMDDPNDGRVHLIREETLRRLGGGLYEAMTLCGRWMLGFLPHDGPHPATCDHCLAAQRAE